jgi:hypothetical protein
VIGFSGLLRDGFVPVSRNHAFVGFILVRMECRLPAVHSWELGPQLMGTVATAIPDMKSNNSAGCSIHGNPDPLPMGLFLHNSPYLIGFRFQLVNHHMGWTLW